MKPEFKHLAILLQTAKEISIESGDEPRISFVTLTEIMAYIRDMEVTDAARVDALKSATTVLKRARGLRRDADDMIADLQEQVTTATADLIRRNEELANVREAFEKVTDTAMKNIDRLGEARSDRDKYRTMYEQEKSRSDSHYRSMEAQRNQKDGAILACMAIAEGKYQ